MTAETRRPATDFEVPEIARGVLDLAAGIAQETASSGDAVPRSTSSSTVARTAAATAARQRKAAERAAVRLAVEQVGSLPDVYLVALTGALLGEVQRRGLALEVP